MSLTGDQSTVYVSLEPHLVDALRPLLNLLPPEVANELRSHITPAITPGSGPSDVHKIPYNVLLSISRWSRTPAGLSVLNSQTPKLDPQSYSMISLLAGATTSPDRKFPPFVPQEEEQRSSRIRDVDDRKAITALVNALLSIIGSGFATWWAAGRLNWKDEWRMLLSLFAALVVTIAEAALYTIWQSRKRGRLAQNMSRLQAIAAQRRKYEDMRDRTQTPVIVSEIVQTQSFSDDRALSGDRQGLRQRVVANVHSIGDGDRVKKWNYGN